MIFFIEKQIQNFTTYSPEKDSLEKLSLTYAAVLLFSVFFGSRTAWIFGSTPP